MAETQLNISELARQSGYSRTTVRRRLKRGWTPDTLDAVAPIHDVATPSTKAVQGVEAAPVSLPQLRRDIQDWTKLHQEVDRLRKPRRELDPRMIFFVIAVAFYGFVAF